jgi:dihydrofolate reductase
MGKVYVELGISLDGFIAGPDARPDKPLGDRGAEIHEWVYSLRSWRQLLGIPGGESGPDDDIVRASAARAGAYVMGRRMFDEGELGWPVEAPFHRPVFVLTHRAREAWVRPGGTTFHFVTEGIARALEQARAAAGREDVRIAGGADVVGQYLQAGLVDELRLHVAPVLLGGGVRLFDHVAPDRVTLEPTEVVASPRVTHLAYRVVK